MYEQAEWGKDGHFEILTDRQTDIYTARLSKKPNCMSYVGSLQFPLTHMFKADGGNVGKVKFTHARTLQFTKSGEV